MASESWPGNWVQNKMTSNKTERRTWRVVMGVGFALLLAVVGGGCGSRSAVPQPTLATSPTLAPQPEVSPLLSPLPSPSPVPVDTDGKLLFQSNRDGNYDIYVMDLETGMVTRLTDSPEHEFEPALSPDGTRIAFARARIDMSGQDIYVMNADGTDPQRIVYMDESIAMCPDWSPDGSQIIFYATRASHFHLFAVSLADGEVRELPSSEQNDLMPDWSPDGTQIAFASDREGQGELYVMAPDGSNLQRLTESTIDEWRPRWSPDGRHIVFQAKYTGHWEIHLIDVDTGEIEQLTDGKEESKMPYWSGDGRLIYYAHEEQGDSDLDYDIYVLDIERRMSFPLTQTPEVDDGYPVWIGR
jgi:Tol biopolymer transport system component